MSDDSDHRRGGQADRGEAAVAGRAHAGLPRSRRLRWTASCTRSSWSPRSARWPMRAPRRRRSWRAGPRGPLHGIPIGLKDIVDTKGIRTTWHSKILQDNVPDTDATCAVKLAEAGTVLLGKLATHEFADGGPSFDLPWPPARNPWNTAHFTAGSCSGTGAAVAAGLILGGIGTDTGGSIRGPAALCGIAGIKPTYGLVSRAGVAPAAFTLDHIGPMAWTAEDCALMLQAIAGHDPRDPASASRPDPELHRATRQPASRACASA